MKICVLQPDYRSSSVDYRHYDPPRNLSALLPEHQVDHVFLDKRTTYKQLAACARNEYDIYVNLCEGYLDWDIPSIDVIDALERLRLPYTGPNALLYDPSKPLMKYVAHTAGVRTPAHRVVTSLDDVRGVCDRLRAPWFVKPAHAGDSLGIDEGSRVDDVDALTQRVEAMLRDYPSLLVEEYIDGREFTVLMVGTPHGDGSCTTFAPVEFEFPPGPRFKTYALKTSELHPRANIPVRDDALAAQLRDAAARVFKAFGGLGYARMDFRLDATSGALFFLEVNFACSVFYTDGFEGSADYILLHDGTGQRGFAQQIIAEGIARHQRRAVPYAMHGSDVAGYGIVATRPIAANEVVYRGEGRAQRLVTRRHVETHWNDADRALFAHYAYPVSNNVYALWDEDPTAWAPQNHSCDPNTAFDGLDVRALRPIAQGDELTIDYGLSMNEESAAFQCRCGAPACRGEIRGTPGNSISAREKRRARQQFGDTLSPQ